jgi:hypothetical protein
LAISGVVSSNPLGAIEVEQSIDTPILKKATITSAGFGHSLMEMMTQQEKALKVK